MYSAGYSTFKSQPKARQSTLSDVNNFGTKLGVRVTENFCLILLTEGNKDETEIKVFERRH